MKLITGQYKRLALIECSCCREAHTIELSLDKDDKTLWFSMNERYKGIWDRIKIWIKIVKNPNAFINGLQRNWNEILMTRSQVEEIVEILETEGYIATSPDSETTSTTVKLDDYTISNFDANGVLFGKETDSETYILAIHLREEDDYWSFTKGDNCNCISAQEVGDFLYSIKQLIGDSNANM